MAVDTHSLVSPNEQRAIEQGSTMLYTSPIQGITPVSCETATGDITFVSGGFLGYYNQIPDKDFLQLSAQRIAAAFQLSPQEIGVIRERPAADEGSFAWARHFYSSYSHFNEVQKRPVEELEPQAKEQLHALLTRYPNVIPHLRTACADGRIDGHYYRGQDDQGGYGCIIGYIGKAYAISFPGVTLGRGAYKEMEEWLFPVRVGETPATTHQLQVVLAVCDTVEYEVMAQARQEQMRMEAEQNHIYALVREVCRTYPQVTNAYMTAASEGHFDWRTYTPHAPIGDGLSCCAVGMVLQVTNQDDYQRIAGGEIGDTSNFRQWGNRAWVVKANCPALSALEDLFTSTICSGMTRYDTPLLATLWQACNDYKKNEQALMCLSPERTPVLCR